MISLAGVIRPERPYSLRQARLGEYHTAELRLTKVS
jgi:hypothetical protein